MSVWFYSDPHFGHNNIIDFCNRPFVDEFSEEDLGGGVVKRRLRRSRVEVMDAALISNWNDVVHPTDTVYVLGDWAMGRAEDGVSKARRLHGEKFLVPGNHDKCWFGGKKDHSGWVSFFEASGFTILANSVDEGNGVISLNELFEDVGVEVDACHFPFNDPSDPRIGDRFAAYKPDDRGQWLLHGHVHDAWKTKLEERMINVGVDVWDLAPVHIDTLKEIIRGALSEVV